MWFSLGGMAKVDKVFPTGGTVLGWFKSRSGHQAQRRHGSAVSEVDE